MLWEYFVNKAGLEHCLDDKQRSQIGTTGKFLGENYETIYRSEFIEMMDQFFRQYTGAKMNQKEGGMRGQKEGGQGSEMGGDQGSGMESG